MNSLILNLSPILGRPPTIQKIFLLLCKANLVDWKLVAFESFIKIKFFFFKKISYLWGNPLKEFKESIIFFWLIPNTFNSHKLIYWSKEYDCHTEVVENLFKAYFEKSKDISNIDILLEIAEDSGLNKEEIRKKFSEDVDNETIIEEEKKNRENGVMGVPTYVINDGITLTGSQSVDSLVKLLKHMSSN